MKFAAIAFGLLGSIVPIWGIWIALASAAAYGRWEFGHVVMFAVPLCLEFLVLFTAVAIFLKRYRLTVWTGGVSIVSILSLVALVVVATGLFASRWH